jgi:cytochrome c oxidase assembly factor CtaG
MPEHNMMQPWFLQWNWDPMILINIFLLAIIYISGRGYLRHRYHTEEDQKIGQRVAFFVAMSILFFALVSPLNALPRYLFVGHMLQHLLLSFVVAPLLVLSLPTEGIVLLVRNRPLPFAWKWLTMPLIASLLFNGNIWLWHAPPLLGAMMQDHLLHLLAQVLYILTGILFWWPLIGPVQTGVFPLNIAGKLVYILLSDMPMVLLGAGLTLMPPLYEVYRSAPRLGSISPELDQQLGGLLMWVPVGIFMIVIASILFLRWMIGLEARQKEEDARRLAELGGGGWS